ncbi:MAG: DNA-binding protein [Microbacterium sp.]|jgi:DNA-binding CsgD family transcriptional regulator|nr:DNA-binding protein [Microbacterium sp.]
MPGSPSSIHARGALRAAITATAARLAPGSGVPTARHLALIAESEPLLPPVEWTDSAALVLATQFSARARHDALSLGTTLIDRYFDGARLRRPATLSAGVRSQLYSSVAEYCCALGWTRVGAHFGAEAQLFADTDALRYRALTVRALAQSMNAEFREAAADIHRADELFAAAGWAAPERAFAHVLAEIIVNSARGDAERLRQLGRELTSAQPDDPFWSFTAVSADVLARTFDRDFAGAFALSSELLYGSRRQSSHRAVRFFLTCIRADMLVARGEHEEALATMSTHDDSDGHGFCVATQRAVSLLHLGRERDVIVETDACAANEADHNLRTLAPLLARRAVALRRLGQTSKAVRSMESVILLTNRVGESVLPFRMLPHDEVCALLEVVAVERPELHDAIEEIRAVLPKVTIAAPEAAPPSAATVLTSSERSLAEMLSTSRTLGDIARARGVSVNTVKSQARSIYLKLGVRGRAEVARHLVGRPLT